MVANLLNLFSYNTNSFNPIALTTVNQKLGDIWREDNPFLADAPTVVSSDQIKRAAAKAEAAGDANLSKGLTILANELSKGNRLLDTNGDGKLQVSHGFTTAEEAMKPTELGKFAGATNQFQLDNVTLDRNDFGSTQNDLKPILAFILLISLFGGQQQGGNGVNPLLLLLLLGLGQKSAA